MVKIRALRKKDGLIEIIVLSREFFFEYENYHKEFFKINELQDKILTLFFRETINNRDSKTFVAIDSKKIIGYITVSIKTRLKIYQIRKVGYISGLMVNKNFRKQGIAKKLLGEAKKWFRTKKVKYYTLETSSNNKRAISFYEKNNIKPLKTQRMGKL